MKNEKKLKNWDKPVYILVGLLSIVVLAFAVYYLTLTKPPGCFKFDDGTTQNWTLDQLYDSNSNPPSKVSTFVPGTNPVTYTPFNLANHQNIALEADTNLFLVGDKNVTKTDIYFESPDLINDLNWQNIVGYSIDIRREFLNKCWDAVPGTYFAQLQMKVIDLSDNKEYLIAELDNTNPANFKFNEILKSNTPYPLEWKWGNQLSVGGKTLTSSGYKIKQLRIRITMPGYNKNGECIYYGKWKIGNICPIK